MRKIPLPLLAAWLMTGSLSAQCYTATAISYNPVAHVSPLTTTIMDDQNSMKIPIGFSFCFYGQSYSKLVISSNGYLLFDTTQANAYSQWPINSPIPAVSGAPKGAIMFPWQDLFSTGSIIRYETMGTAPNRKFVVSFDSIPYYSCTTSYFTGQVVLEETTNAIETHILSKPLCPQWNSGRAIHGLHNQTGTMATVVPGRNSPTQWTVSNDGYLFSPSCNVCSGVAVEETPATGGDGVAVFPNPAKTELTVSLPEIPAAPYSVSLRDNLGRELFLLKEQKEKQARFDLQQIPAGVYLLYIAFADRSAVLKKVVVE